MTKIRQPPAIPFTTGLFVSVAGLMIGLTLVIPDTVAWPLQLGVLVLGVVLFGLPHGALDPWTAQRSDLGLGIVIFNLLYLGLAGLVVLAWWWQPTVTLGAFLLLSAWHFSHDWPAAPRWLGLSLGLALLVLPAWFHPDEVARIFMLLAPGEGDRLARWLNGLGWPLMPMLAAALLYAARHIRMTVIEVVMLVGLAWSVPPLLYFVVYFCCLHSPRHLLKEMQLIQSNERGQAIRGMATYTIAAVVLATLAAWLMGPTRALDQRLTELVFIGLAALTVPHMALILYVQHRTTPTSR